MNDNPKPIAKFKFPDTERNRLLQLAQWQRMLVETFPAMDTAQAFSLAVTMVQTTMLDEALDNILAGLASIEEALPGTD